MKNQRLLLTAAKPLNSDSTGTFKPSLPLPLQKEVEQYYAQQRASYYSEIISIITGKKFASSYIAHHGKIDEKNQRNIG